MTSRYNGVQIKGCDLRKRNRNRGSETIISYFPSTEFCSFPCQVFVLDGGSWIWFSMEFLSSCICFSFDIFQNNVNCTRKKHTVSYYFSFLSATLVFISGSVSYCNRTKEMIGFSFLNVTDQCLRKFLISRGLLCRTEEETKHDFQEFLSTLLLCSFQLVANDLQWQNILEHDIKETRSSCIS